MGRRYRRERSTIDRLVAEIEGDGYSVQFVEWCEDGETPGFLGQAAGVTDHTRRKVKVRRGQPARATVAILAHELQHVRGERIGDACPEFGLRCGNGLA